MTAGEDLTAEYADVVDTSSAAAASEIMDALAENAKGLEKSSSRFAHISAAARALSDIVEDSPDPSRTADRARQAAGEVAQKAQIPKQQIIDELNAEIREAERSAIMDSGGYRVDVGIGLDRYLEEYLDEIVVQRTSDSVDDPLYIWEFSDGVSLEIDDGAHLNPHTFFKKISAASSLQIVPELASEKAEDHADTDEEYANLSLGPIERPWKRSSDMWARSVTGLIAERSRDEVVTGVRTEAWDLIQRRISSSRGVRDRADAVEHSMLYVDDENGEVWVPTSMVGAVCDELEIGRRHLQIELAARDVTSRQLSGDRISEAVTENGRSMRFWRLDLDAEEVPDPGEIIDEIADPVETDIDVGGGRSPVSESDTPADDSGAETFGRSPENDDSGGDSDTEDDSDPGDHDSTAGGDGGGSE